MYTKSSKTVLALVLSFLLVAQSPVMAAGQDFAGHWAATQIQTFMDEGLVQGYPDGSFRPDQDITRAEFIKWVNAFLGFDAKGKVEFTDVSEAAWFYDEVAKAVEQGYITGYDGLFKPNASISRQEVAVIIARIMKLAAAEEEAKSFTDADAIADWSKAELGAVVKHKYMQGYPDNSFKPCHPLTRAEALVILARILEDYNKPVTPTPTHSSSGGGGGGGSSADTAAPIVKITEPSAADSLQVTEPMLSIAGTATDNKSVVEVTYGVNEEQAKPTEGLSAWQAKHIALHLGTNQITVTAKDGAGNSASDSLAVNYVPFTGALQVSQESMFVGEEVPIQFRIAVQDNAEVDLNSLQVMVVGEEGLEPLGTLTDDGNIENGDDIASDGVYSASVRFNAADPGTYRFVVIVTSADGKYTGQSEFIDFSVLEHLSEADFVAYTELESQVEELLSVYEEVYGDTASSELVNWLDHQPGVMMAGLAPEGESIWYALDSGLLGGKLINEVDVKGSRTSAVVKSAITALEAEEPVADSTNFIGKRVAVVSPFASQGAKLPVQAFDNVTELFIQAGYPTERCLDTQASVDFFKQSQYEVLILDTHGEALFNANLDANLPQLDNAYADAGAKVVFLTGEAVRAETWQAYEEELLTGKLALVDGYYAVTPAFVKAYNRNLPGTFVYNGSCRSTYNDSLAKAYLAGGAKAYYGFDQSVAVAYDNVIVEEVFNQLVNVGATTGEARLAAMNKYGLTDKAYLASLGVVKLGKPAECQLLGNSGLRLIDVGLQNGSFEQGFDYWANEGDARIISKLGPLQPQDGSNMAIISTGLGSVGESDSTLVQTFLVPEGATTLALDYNVISEEPMEWVGEGYNDAFITLIASSQTSVAIAEETIDTAAWLPVEGIDFYDGDDTTFQTDWQHVEVDVAEYAGKGPITLVFRTWDSGDSAYDTAALIDNVELK